MLQHHPRLKPIHIGPILLDCPVLLAPMSGVSDMPFRKMVKKFGAGLVVSEMIASVAMIRDVRKTFMRAKKGQGEYPMAVQLAGCEAEIMAEAAKLNEDMGADMIDINFGCPAKKVVNGYAGSALMRDERLAAQILQKTVQAVRLPVTLKMRTGWDDHHRNAPVLAKIAEDVGIQMITIHGRTRAQFYSGRSDWTFIRHIKDQVKIPVIANGDIVDFNSVDQCLEESGADGVMIGRGTYGRPWFVHQVMHYLKTGDKTDAPNVLVQKNAVLEHFEEMLGFYGSESGVRMARKHLGWYSKGLRHSTDFRTQVNRIMDVHEIKHLIEHFFDVSQDGEVETKENG